MAVGAVKLPGPSVENLAEMAIDEGTGTFYAFKPGVAVGIRLGSVTDPEQVQQGLEEKIEEAGWVYDDGSPIQIHAEMGIAPPREETYRRLGVARGDNTTRVTVMQPPTEKPEGTPPDPPDGLPPGFTPPRVDDS